jgi:hypothetical protein
MLPVLIVAVFGETLIVLSVCWTVTMTSLVVES